MRGSTGDLYFEAERTSSDLWLTLWGTNALGEPDEEDFVELAFAIDGGVPPRGGVAPGAGGSPLSGGNPATSGNPLGHVSFEGGNFTIAQIVANGNESHTSGELRVATLTCGGNANFQGSALLDFAGGLVDVAGDILFATSTVVINPPSGDVTGRVTTSSLV